MRSLLRGRGLGTLWRQIIGSREESDFVILNNLYSQQGVGADHIIAEVKNNGTSGTLFLSLQKQTYGYLEDIHLTISLFSGCFFILFQQSCMLSNSNRRGILVLYVIFGILRQKN